MIPSETCLRLIQKFEGFSGKPYLCPAKVPTIGYGSTRYANGKAVTLKDPMISKAFAYTLLVTMVNKFAAGVAKLITVELTQNQFDALVSFSYNVGLGAFKKSTLLKYVNESRFELASDEFKKWVKVNGEPSRGLMNRRIAEVALFTN